jgi:AraC-like DNA-binding protein
MTITRVAFSVGFNSVRSFNRVFANSTGCTPLEYRKRACRGE